MPIDRRQFCTAVGAAGVSTFSLSALAVNEEPQKPKQPLRVIAYNVLVARGWPSDRWRAEKARNSGQMARRIALELALYQPDIVNFSESPSEEIVKEVAGYLGMQQVRFPSGEHWPGTLMSRYEITESENCPLGRERPSDLFTRHWGRATVILPGGEGLVIHSVHLHPRPQEPRRRKEIEVLLETIKPDLDTDKSMLLMGDLNHIPDTPEYKLWVEAGWVDTFAQVGQGEGLTCPSDRPVKRIDYVWARGKLAQQIVEARPLFEGAFRVNLADGESFALSDHVPQLAVFDLAK